MARSDMIKVMSCPRCGNDDSRWGSCQPCRQETGEYTRLVQIERPKKQAIGNFTVVSWYSTKASAVIVLEDQFNKRYEVYMSDLFKFLEGHTFDGLVLEEVKKGQAYGWYPKQ